MLEDLRNYILADATVGTLVGSRMYPGQLPQGPTVPALTYSVITATRTPTMSGPDGLPSKRVQIDAWATTMTAALELAEAVRARIDGFAGTAGTTVFRGIFADTERQLYESEPKLHRYSRDFIVWPEES